MIADSRLSVRQCRARIEAWSMITHGLTNHHARFSSLRENVLARWTLIYRNGDVGFMHMTLSSEGRQFGL